MNDNIEQVPDALIQSALDTITRAEIDIQIATAKKFPRSIKHFLDTAIGIVTLDEETAASCIFRLPRGGKSIEGKSVRLAEVCASSYQNLRIAGRIKEITATEVVAEAVAMDLENNVGYSGESRRRITNKSGQRFNDDMIIMTANAVIAIATRNATFKAIPLPLVEKVYNAAKKLAVGDAETLPERRDKMLKYFSGIGIKKEQVFMILEVGGLDDIGLDDLETMIGYANAIREGTPAEDIFNPQKVTPDAGEKVTSVAKPTVEVNKKIAADFTKITDPLRNPKDETDLPLELRSNR